MKPYYVSQRPSEEPSGHTEKRIYMADEVDAEIKRLEAEIEGLRGGNVTLMGSFLGGFLG